MIKKDNSNKSKAESASMGTSQKEAGAEVNGKGGKAGAEVEDGEAGVEGSEAGGIDPKGADGKAARKKEPAQDKLKELQEKIGTLEKQVADSKGDYLRLMAEFETFRRRSAEDKLNIVTTASAETIKGMLPVLDDCQRALQILAGSSDQAAREGTQLIYDKLMAYLRSKGLAEIEARGAEFNTDFHEAVTQIPAPSEEMKGKVIDVIQTGYTLSGKILRYAKVVVGA